MTDTITETEKAPELAPDLEKIRDERCVPIVKSILGDMAEMLIPAEPLDSIDVRELAIKGLERMRDADLNLTTETTYVPQLILGVLSGLNATVQQCATVPLDRVHLNGVARKILAIVAQAELRIVATPEEVTADFVPVQEQLNALFTEEKISYVELKYIMDEIFASYTALNNLMSQTVEEGVKRAEAKLFGIEDMTDLSLKRVDDVLK